jgi:hypothetical protein
VVHAVQKLLLLAVRTRAVAVAAASTTDGEGQLVGLIASAIRISAVGFDRAAFYASFDAVVLRFFNKTLGARSRI